MELNLIWVLCDGVLLIISCEEVEMYFKIVVYDVCDFCFDEELINVLIEVIEL